ncbi:MULTISPECIES: GntR family transcriptional regulator [unclassified Streptomyces]|uniref:GntR family transcriptional regulator n=1 Tax=unclassified Streptomyces TaxID=2593676 RepID=UPI002DDC032D|nr:MULTISPECIES: GntR family transcriptional regulator [unclassified Streptomyces]WSA05033.1 GntR family transcriptional regulator [Streptomyces sp. NBC_00841]WSJ91950.1 GntR family transcriptional regulator [Streptomyces sp. NBC_01320]WSK01137.1 GntR family transcriptional regulator [Streptomyces sp. NBC_01320]
MTDAARTRPTVAEQVAKILRDEIQHGQLAPGSPLRQNEIAARLRVSSTPVREAFQILERSGLVVREGRRGVQVFRPSVSDLVNGYEVRIALESMAAGLAAERLTNAAHEHLAATVARMHQEPVPPDEYLRLNADFHAQIARGSGNPRLEELVITEQAAVATYISFLGVDPSSAHEAQEEHEAVLYAIARGDSAGAVEAMRLHLQKRVNALRIRLSGAAENDQEVVTPAAR